MINRLHLEQRLRMKGATLLPLSTFMAWTEMTLRARACVCARARVCVCVCVCELLSLLRRHFSHLLNSHVPVQPNQCKPAHEQTCCPTLLSNTVAKYLKSKWLTFNPTPILWIFRWPTLACSRGGCSSFLEIKGQKYTELLCQ